MSLLVGIVATALGLMLLAQPFTSVTLLTWLLAGAAVATGIGRILAARADGDGALGVGLGAVWVVLGVAIVAWPGLSVRGLALLVGIGLVISGVGDVAAAARGSTDARLASALRGIATLAFGVVALSWPDVTLLVIAVVFGAEPCCSGSRSCWQPYAQQPMTEPGVSQAGCVGSCVWPGPPPPWSSRSRSPW